jgi:hypothetical protein
MGEKYDRGGVAEDGVSTEPAAKQRCEAAEHQSPHTNIRVRRRVNDFLQPHHMSANITSRSSLCVCGAAGGRRRISTRTRILRSSSCFSISGWWYQGAPPPIQFSSGLPLNSRTAPYSCAARSCACACAAVQGSATPTRPAQQPARPTLHQVLEGQLVRSFVYTDATPPSSRVTLRPLPHILVMCLASRGPAFSLTQSCFSLSLSLSPLSV